MTTNLDIAIEISDLFEATRSEGSLAAQLFDSEILPYLKTPLHETIGLGDRFSKVIDRVKAVAMQTGDSIRTIKDMMKAALLTYVQKTNDTQTAREIFHRAITTGADTMLTITGAAILANALAGQHQQQATGLIRGIASKMSGKQPAVVENASGGAVSTGSIAVATSPINKKKQIIRRQDSIFAEQISWEDLQGLPVTISLLENVVERNETIQIEGVMVDPTTAELVLSVHRSLASNKQRQYECKSLDEMIGIAYRAVQRGLINVVMEEG